MGVGGQNHASAVLLPGKSGYPFYRRQGGPQSLDECGKSRPHMDLIAGPSSP